MRRTRGLISAPTEVAGLGGWGGGRRTQVGSLTTNAGQKEYPSVQAEGAGAEGGGASGERGACTFRHRELCVLVAELG